MTDHPPSSIQEVLVLHHSHTDIGYTHAQPVLWELQRRFIDQALDLCEQTADWPEASRVRWTCETTMPVRHWLKHASSRQIERFRQLAAAGQISISAMPCNITPLYDAAQLAEELGTVKQLRADLNVPLTTAINHDVNGLPWPITQLLLDTGVDLLLMGINVHFGGFPLTRPLGFRWRGSDGRNLLVWNGEHYQGFDRTFRLAEGSTAAMAAGFAAYAAVLARKQYPHDFIFLTATHPSSPDNNPPRAATAELIRRWNSEGRSPVIRYVTPESLQSRLQQLPPDALATHTGDWPDFWSFGCGSAAFETRINRETKCRLKAADLLLAAQKPDANQLNLRRRAWWNCDLADEHTYGSWHCVDEPTRDNVAEQWLHKAGYVQTARSLAGFLLRDALEAVAGNPAEASGVQGVLLYNPAPFARSVFTPVPKPWLEGRWDHQSATVQGLESQRERWLDTDSALVGPIDLPASGWRIVPIADLKPATVPTDIASGHDFIESPFYRLQFDPTTGRVTKLWDKIRNTQLLATGTEWSFFGFVQETTASRADFFEMDWSRINVGIAPWKTDWLAIRRSPPIPASCRVETSPTGIGLVLEWTEAPGVDQLHQRITLLAHRPAIELTATFHKRDIQTPEGLYFTFPLNLADWRAHYDTAGLPVEFDNEQLPGACRDFTLIDHWVSLHNARSSITLACPDAPLVQIGDFSFGRRRKSVPRSGPPLLLGWAMNNYWNTNFPASQPGFTRVRYELTSNGPFEPVKANRAAFAASDVELHPVIKLDSRREGRLIEVQPAHVLPLHVKSSNHGSGIIVRLANVADMESDATIALPGRGVRQAFVTDTLGENCGPLVVTDGIASIRLRPRSILSVRLE